MVALSLDLAERLPKDKAVRRSLLPIVITYVEYAKRARRNGILSLDGEEVSFGSLGTEELHVFATRSLMWVVDALDPQLIESNLEAVLSSKGFNIMSSLL